MGFKERFLKLGGGLIILGGFTLLFPAQAQDSAADITVHSSVVAANPVPFGFNVQSGLDPITNNDWIVDGGMAPLTNRFSFTADSGTANTFVDVTAGGYATDFYDSIASGFFNGATAFTYRYANGAWTLLRTDTVTSFTAVSGSTNAADHTITFANNGPVVQAGDIVWLNQDFYANLNLSTISTRMQQWTNDSWMVYGPTGNPPDGTTLYYSRVADGPPGDNVGNPSQSLPECMSITTTKAQVVYMGQYSQDFVGPNDEGFDAGHTYTASVWLKEPLLANGQTGSVTFNINSNMGITKTFTGVTNAWQQFTYSFGAVANLPANQAVPQFQLYFTGPATLEVDDFEVYDNSHSPLTLDPRVMTSWQNFMPGTMRIWSDFAGPYGNYLLMSFDAWLTAENKGRNTIAIGSGGYTNAELQHLPTSLAYCKQMGAQPWLIAPMSLTQQEWSNLIDFLAGPSSTPYGAMRPSNHPNPYTNDFNTIYIEFGNEEWGTQSTAANVQYGAYAHLMLSAAKANPNFNSKIKFIVNGFSGNPDFGPNNVATAPEASLVDYFSYTGGTSGLTGNAYYQSELLQLPNQYQSQIGAWVTSEQQSAATGFPYTIAVYEGGPGSDNPNTSGGGDDTLAAAVATLDVFLYGSQSGVGPQNLFAPYLGTNAYSSNTNFHNGFLPHPVWEALQMRNQYCNGPMTLTELNETPVSTDGNNYPLIASYTFHDSAGNADVWVLSRDVANSTPVTIHLPTAATGNATLYMLTGGPNGAGANNDTAMTVPVTSQTISNFGNAYSFTLPPSSAYLFVVPTGAWPTPGPSSATAQAGLDYAYLSWTAVSGATSYDIYRSTSPTSFSSTPYATNVNGTSYSDTNVTDGTTYYYRVTAVTSSGQTDASNLTSTTPLACRWNDSNFTTNSTTSANLTTQGWANYFSTNGVNPQGALGNYYSMGYGPPPGTPLTQVSLGTSGGDPGNFIQLQTTYNYDLVLPLAAPPTTETWTVSFDYEGNLSNSRFSVWTSNALSNLIYYWDGAYGNSGTNTSLTGDMLLTNTGSTWTHFTTNVTVPAGAAKVTLSWGGDATGGGITNIVVTKAATPPASDTPAMPPWGLVILGALLLITAVSRLPGPGQFHYWSGDKQACVVEAGADEIQIGASSGDIR